MRPLAQHLTTVRTDLWKPIVCASLVCFAWSLASHLPALYDNVLVTAMLLGLGAACLVVAAIGLFSKGEMGFLDIYQAFFPLIGIVLFIPAFFGEQWLALLVGFLTFGARLMLLLTYMLSAAYAARTQFSPCKVLLLCMWPLQIASFVGDTAGFLMAQGPLFVQGSVLRIPAACLIMCFVGLIAVSLGKRPRSLAEPVDDTLLINPGNTTWGSLPNSTRNPSNTDTVPLAKNSIIRKGAAPSKRVFSPRQAFGARRMMTQTESEKDSPLDKAHAKQSPGLPIDGRRTETNIPMGSIDPSVSEEADLSARELEVIALLLKGNTTAAISRKFFISENTTRGHMKRIYRKLDVHSRQELVDLIEEGGGDAPDSHTA